MTRQELEATIMSGVTNETDRLMQRNYRITTRRHLVHTDGRKFSPFGIPNSVDRSVLTPSEPFYVFEDCYGITFGQRYATEEEINACKAEIRAKKLREMSDALPAMSMKG